MVGEVAEELGQGPGLPVGLGPLQSLRHRSIELSSQGRISQGPQIAQFALHPHVAAGDDGRAGGLGLRGGIRQVDECEQGSERFPQLAALAVP